MSRKWFAFLLVCIWVVSMLGACGGGLDALSLVDARAENPGGNEQVSVTAQADVAATAIVENSQAVGDIVAEAVAHDSQGNENVGADSVAAAMAENSDDHGDEEDYAWDSSASTQIVLDESSITVDGDGVTVDGSKVTITAAGTYNIRGSLADGQIIVNTEDEKVVRLVLSGVEINSSTSAPIVVLAAEETMIVLADNTENYISDAESYVFEDPEVDEPNAAVFAKSDLTIYGNGSLIVDGFYNDGIASKDGLIIAGGTIVVHAVDDGIRGKDYLVVQDGNITVSAQGDGLKSDNEEDAEKGYVLLEDGVMNVTAGGDAIDAQTDVLITDGEISLSAGGGSNSRIDESSSAKGIKAAVNVNIDGGTLTIDSADDAIHSNGNLVINGGTFVIATGDDAMHADSALKVNGGTIRITDSFEGIESAVITINDGDIHIISSDDGINVAGGVDSSGMNPGPGRGGGPVVSPGQGGGLSQDAFTYSGDYYLYINGGYIAMDTLGDGIDVNGAIEMTDGVVIVNGPIENMNGALDYDASFKITGGFLVAAGSSGMAQAPDESSTQYSVLLNLNGTLPADTLIHVQSSEGDQVLTFAPTKQVQSIALSSPDLINGATYDVYYGGSSTGAGNDGLYLDGAYTAGAELGNFTISGIVTRLGSGRR